MANYGNSSRVEGQSPVGSLAKPQETGNQRVKRVLTISKRRLFMQTGRVTT